MNALRTARRLVHDAWLARAGLAVVPRSELEHLRRIAERERLASRRGRRLWVDILRDGIPAEYQEGEPEDSCPTCGTPAVHRACVCCGVTTWAVPCRHMNPPTINFGLDDGSSPSELFCVDCLGELK